MNAFLQSFKEKNIQFFIMFFLFFISLNLQAQDVDGDGIADTVEEAPFYTPITFVPHGGITQENPTPGGSQSGKYAVTHNTQPSNEVSVTIGYQLQGNATWGRGIRAQGADVVEFQVRNANFQLNAGRRGSGLYTITFSKPVKNPLFRWAGLDNDDIAQFAASYTDPLGNVTNNNIVVDNAIAVNNSIDIFNSGTISPYVHSTANAGGQNLNTIDVTISGYVDEIVVNVGKFTNNRSNVTMQLQQFNYTILSDVDNDGKPDFEDTDADGDGCLDVEEGVPGYKTATAPITVTQEPISGIYCSGPDAAAVPLSVVASVSSGNLNYQWQSSTDGIIFSNIPSATSSTYNVPNTSSGTTYYKVLFTGTNSLCASPQSEVATVVVNPPINAGNIFSDASYCSTTNTTVLTLTDFEGDIVRWESSTNNFSTVTNINVTSSVLRVDDLSVTTKYRAVVESSDCPGVFGTSGEAIISINNGFPTANNDTLAILEDEVGSVIVSSNDDIGCDLGDGEDYSLLTNPSNGTIVETADGVFEYTPNLNFNGTDSFTYRITDADGDTATATVLITVTDVANVVPETTDVTNASIAQSAGATALENPIGNDTDGTVDAYEITNIPAVSEGVLQYVDDTTGSTPHWQWRSAILLGAIGDKDTNFNLTCDTRFVLDLNRPLQNLPGRSSLDLCR